MPAASSPELTPTAADLPASSKPADPHAAARSDSRTTVLYLDHTAAMSGGEIALLRLLEALDRSTIRPVVLLAAPGPLVAKLEALGIETTVLPLGESVRNARKDSLGFASLKKLGAIFSVLDYARKVAAFGRRCGAQIIHSNSLKADIYGGLAGRLCGVPVIWHVRDHINASYLPARVAQLFRLLARWVPTFVITNSQSTLNELRLDRGLRTAIVPSGIRLARRSVVHDGLDGDARLEAERVEAAAYTGEGSAAWGRKVRVGIVGRIARWKGQHIFIEAARQVLATGADVEFRIIGAPLFGEEEYEMEIRAQVKAAGLEQSVLFCGFKASVQEIYRDLDIVVHASISAEPFGQVVIEGMAEGVPVIATDGGGVKEIVVHGKNGLLVPMGDASAMAQALLLLLHDRALAHRLGLVGYHWVRQYFTAAAGARKVEAVYEALLRGEAAA